MDRLWGEVRPVPEANLRVLRGGETVAGFEVAYTPGHASHHLSYWHPPTRTAFVGDVAGVRMAPSRYVLAPTPPPDIDVEVWQDSIARVRAWRPEQLAITHFGCFDDVSEHLDAIEHSLALAARRARELTVEEYVAATRADIVAASGARDAPVYALGAPLEQTYAGLKRYWSKRDGES
jgi:glyoxylase-like metal-dependent hydrolase (beta-lactamase superfamily II)